MALGDPFFQLFFDIPQQLKREIGIAHVLALEIKLYIQQFYLLRLLVLGHLLAQNHPNLKPEKTYQ
jgi:hypothetical protein